MFGPRLTFWMDYWLNSQIIQYAICWGTADVAETQAGFNCLGMNVHNYDGDDLHIASVWEAENAEPESNASTPVEMKEKKEKKDKKDKKDKKEKKAKKEKIGEDDAVSVKESEARDAGDDRSQSPSDSAPSSSVKTEPAPAAEGEHPGQAMAKSTLNAKALAALNRAATADLQHQVETDPEKNDDELPELSEHVKKLRHRHLNQFQRSLKSLILSNADPTEN